MNDQMGFWLSLCKIIAIFGGNRSGKSEVAIARAIAVCQGVHPTLSKRQVPPVIGRVVAPGQVDGVALLLEKFQEMTPREWLLGGKWDTAYNGYRRILRFANGSRIRFFSNDQDVNKMGGEALDFVILDEHQREEVFEECIARTVDRNGWIALSMTPEKGITWEEERIVDASEESEYIDYWWFTTYDNPWLTEEGIKAMEALLPDEDTRKRKMLGEFVALAGKVYSEFQDRLGGNVVADHEPPFGVEKFFALDPHRIKPSMMIWMYKTKDGEFVVYRESIFSPHEGGLGYLKQHIKGMSDDDKIVLWIIDEANDGAKKDIFGQESIARQLRKHDDIGGSGIPFMPTGQKSETKFDAGIMRVRDLIRRDPVSGQPRLLIMERCVITRKQMRMYRMRPHTKEDEYTLRERTLNKNDEGPTLIRYITGKAMRAPKQSKPRSTLPRGVKPNRLTGRV